MISDMTNQFEQVPILESDETADLPSNAYESTLPKKRGVIAVLVTVLGLAIAYCMCTLQGSPSKPLPKTGSLRAATILEEADSPAMADAKASFKDWASGKYALEGGQCEETAKSALLSDFTLTTNAAIVDAGIGNQYTGIDGMCAWVKNLEQFDFKTFSPAFYDFGEGRILSTFTWMPALKSGAVADHNVTDASLVVWRDHKMHSFQYFFAEPDSVEKLFTGDIPTKMPEEPTGNFKAWLDLRGVWAIGGFHGSNCTKNVGDHVASSFKMVNVPYIPSTGIDEEYLSTDGFCAWIKDLEKFDWSSMAPTDFAIDDTHFLMINKITPTVKGGVKAPHHVEDVVLITMKDSKMEGFKYFYSEPTVWSALFDEVKVKKVKK